MIAHSPKREPVLVPQWIVQQLTRRSLPLNTILHLDKLAQVVSQEDLAILLDLNQNPAPIMGVSYMGMGLLRYWSNYCGATLQKVAEVLPLYEGKCDARLYAVGAQQRFDCPPAEADDAHPAFTLQEVESGLDTTSVMLIAIQPGFFGGAQSSQVRTALRRAYLKQSYVSLPFSEVAKDSVFLQYLLELETQR